SGELRAVSTDEAVVELSSSARSPVLDLTGRAGEQAAGVRRHDEHEEVVRGIDLVRLVVGRPRDVCGVVLREDHVGARGDRRGMNVIVALVRSCEREIPRERGKHFVHARTDLLHAVLEQGARRAGVALPCCVQRLDEYVLGGVELEHALAEVPEVEQPIHDRPADEDGGVHEHALRREWRISMTAVERAMCITVRTSPARAPVQSSNASSCAASNSRSAACAAARSSARWALTRSTSSRENRVWLPTVNESISPARAHFIRVGRETPSRSAATVVVSSSGILPMVIWPPPAMEVRVCRRTR